MPPEARMANDIAAQFAHLPNEQAAREVAGHVARFWDPRMRARLVALAAAGAEDLRPAARAAADLLRTASQTGR